MTASKLSVRNFIGYGIGDFGFNLAFTLTNVYLLKFYTDVFGISAGAVGTIFFFGRVWDAVNDPVMGWIADQFRSKRGHYRPFLLYGAVPLGMSLILLFYVPDLGPSGKLAYATITYFLFSAAFTLGNVPYGTLNAALTSDYEERSKLAGYRMGIGIIGGMIAAGITEKMVSHFGGGENGYFITSIIYGVIVAGIIFICYNSIREQVAVIREKISLKKALFLVRKNHPFISLTICFVFNFAGLSLLSAMVPYFFQYHLEQKDLQGLGLLTVFGVAALSIIAWVLVAHKIGKRNVYLLGAVIYVTGLISLYFAPADNLPLVFVSLAVLGIGGGSSAFAGWAMLGDTVDFGEWRTGVRVEGTLYGIYGFFFKLGSGLGQAMAGWGLALFAYRPPVENLFGDLEPQIQSGLTIEGIRMLPTLIPAAMILGSMLALSFYEISKERHEEVLEAIEKEE